LAGLFTDGLRLKNAVIFVVNHAAQKNHYSTPSLLLCRQIRLFRWFALKNR
jgi:hypothetical protein